MMKIRRNTIVRLRLAASAIATVWFLMTVAASWYILRDTWIPENFAAQTSTSTSESAEAIARNLEEVRVQSEAPVFDKIAGAIEEMARDSKVLTSSTEQEMPKVEKVVEEQMVSKIEADTESQPSRSDPEPELVGVSKTEDSTTTEVTSDNQQVAFEGSRHSIISPGLALLENVCIEFNSRQLPNYKAPHRFIKPKMYSHDINETTAETAPLFNIFNPAQRDAVASFMQNAKQYPLKQWDLDTKHGSNVISTETLWTETLFENPGHCINDIGLNLALDHHNRHNRDRKDEEFLYAQYIRSSKKTFYKTNTDKWCPYLFEAAKLVRKDDILPLDENKGQYCFRKLLIPNIVGFRYPNIVPNNSSNASPESEAYKWMKMDNLSLADKEYPLEAILSFRDRIYQNFGLDREPWPVDDSDNKEETKSVLLHVRPRGQRRRIMNVEHLSRYLEAYYNVNIKLMEEEWGSFNVTEQAKVYNSYEYILSAHGGHLGNRKYERRYCVCLVAIAKYLPVSYNCFYLCLDLGYAK